MKADARLEKELCATQVSFDELISTSDIVTIHTPLTKGSRGLIDAKVLRVMKQSAIIINTARGGAIVEADLVAALSQKLIAGAGLDVFEAEPLGNSPLLKWKMLSLRPTQRALQSIRGGGDLILHLKISPAFPEAKSRFL